MSISENVIKQSPSKIFSEARGKLMEKASQAISEEKKELLEGRFKRVNRVRNGKVQRRKKVSTRSGYKTTKGGDIKRMSAQEKQNRSRSQRKGARKRRAKSATANRHRQRSMRKSNRLS